MINYKGYQRCLLLDKFVGMSFGMTPSQKLNPRAKNVIPLEEKPIAQIEF